MWNLGWIRQKIFLLDHFRSIRWTAFCRGRRGRIRCSF
jgi:hypothetical protein